MAEQTASRTTHEDPDLVEVLLEQHQRIREEFAEVQSATGADRAEAFDSLRTLLAAHETAEEMVVRPATRSEVSGGDAIADARVEEERNAKLVLSRLDGMDVADPEFESHLANLKGMVEEHAEAEERDEFPALRAALDPDRRRKLGSRLLTVEKVAPTHPHPHANSTTANMVLGPFAAVLDRVRDAFSGSNDSDEDDPTRRPEREPGQAPLTSRTALRATETDPTAPRNDDLPRDVDLPG